MGHMQDIVSLVSYLNVFSQYFKATDTDRKANYIFCMSKTFKLDVALPGKVKLNTSKCEMC